MRRTTITVRLLAAVALVSLAACQDTSEPLSPEAPNEFQAADRAGEALRAVMALDRTVFGGYDASGRLVIGVEDAGINRGVAQVLERFGMGSSDYEVQVTDPIYMLSDNLRSVHRPTRGGIQIHFGNYLCTLGFNVDHAGGRSFITNSHCTDRQGGVDGTVYYQPVSSADPDPIAVEVDDPAYFKGGECSRGKQCRYSDAARAQYNAGIGSNGEIAKTDGVNSGSLNVVGSFDITSQDDTNTSFSGTVHKVGRTTGWGAGTVTGSCVTVNVSGSNIQLLCQTLVQSGGAAIVGGGDSGSPVFRQTGSNTAQLLGILWGGNSAGDLFVFSPLKSIQDELGDVDATTDGTGGGDGGDGGDCTPRGNSGQCK